MLRGKAHLYLERGLHISIEEWSGGSKGSKSARLGLGLNPSLTTFHLYAPGQFSHSLYLILLTYEMEIVIVPRRENTLL